MEILFNNRNEWRLWLEENSKFKKEVWLVYYKKHINKQSISYEEAVMEALCFGWIDSLVKRIDDEKYKQKYTPRKPRSNWSESNKRRIIQLEENELMKKEGLFAVKRAKENGSWDNLTGVDDTPVPPQALLEALSENPLAELNFNSFPLSTRKQYIGWLKSARKEETKVKRIREIVKRSEANKKAGIL